MDNIYNWHPITKEFVGTSKADESPLEPGVYLIPSYATQTPIPEGPLEENKIRIWNSIENKWDEQEIKIKDQKPKLELSISTSLKDENRILDNSSVKKFIDAIEPKLLFPTVVREFQCNGYEKENDALLKLILEKEASSRPTYPKYSRNWQTEAFLHNEPEFEWLSKLVTKLGKEYVKFMQYKYDDIVCNGMWANVYRREEDLHRHTHPNSFISGVYYMTDDNSDIKFYDPRTDVRSVIMPEQYENFFNAFIIGIKPIKGMCILFPSWLKHSVVPQPAGFRVSIAFNLMLEGKIGTHRKKTAIELPKQENAFRINDFNDELYIQNVKPSI